MVLNWTGLKDNTYGVPLGGFYLSLPTIREQITRPAPTSAGHPIAGWPGRCAMETMAFNVTSASILTAPEAGLFIGIIALALWLMKMTVSTYWLTVIGGSPAQSPTRSSPSPRSWACWRSRSRSGCSPGWSPFTAAKPVGAGR